MNNLGQYINLIVIVLALAFSALGWLIRQLREQKELRRIEIERQRRRDETLRTGRSDAAEPESSPLIQEMPGSQQPDPGEVKRRLQELADRRRRELEEMRRRSQSGSGSGGEVILAPTASIPTAPRPVATPRPIPTAPRPVPTGPVPVPGRSPQTNAEVERRRRAAAERATRERAQKDAAEQKRRQEAAERERRRREVEARQASEESGAPASVAMVARADAERAETARTAASAAAAVAATHMLPPIDGPQAAQAWRRAIIMMEVMATPAGMRMNNERVI